MADQKVTLGLINPKNPQNVGSALRAARCYGASSVFYSGQRFAYARQFNTDTKQAAREIPLVGCEDLKSMVPKGAKVVAVELVEGATALPAFIHPENAFYLFGPEDASISQEDLSWCDEVVYIPTKGCMNLAATVNVVLYDRMAKSQHTDYGDHIILTSRDSNNNTRWKG